MSSNKSWGGNMKGLKVILSILLILLIAGGARAMTVQLAESGDLKIRALDYQREVYTNQQIMITVIVEQTGGDPLEQVNVSLNLSDCIETKTVNMSENPIDIRILSYSRELPKENQGIAVFICSIATPGVYTGKVKVEAAGFVDTNPSNNEQEFTVNVEEPPVLNFSMPSTIELGSDTAEPGDIVETTFRINNTGDLSMNITLSLDIDSEYEAILSTTNITNLGVGEYVDITLSVKIPSDYEGRQSIGTLTATATNNGKETTKTATIYLEAREEKVFRIKDMDIYVDDDHTDIDPGEEVEVRPGSRIKLEIEVENIFNDDLEDVYVQVYNDDLDIDEETEEVDIDEDDEYRYTVEFTIPYDADEDTYELEIKIRGEDQDGNDYREIESIELEVEKKSHEIRIIDLEVEDSYCGDYSRIIIEVANTGRHDEEDVRVRLKINDLNVDTYKELSLDEGDKDEVVFTVNIPRDAEEGVYIVEVYTYYDIDEDSDYESAILNIKCTEEIQPPEGGEREEERRIVITPAPSYNGTIVIGEEETDKKIVIGMGIISVLLMIVIGLLIARLVQTSNRSNRVVVEKKQSNKRPEKKRKR
ncbi:putative S-layer protein [Candidatus Woesearchaeota archaeon]|nr:putative S-layer protein [Candidatus Woesearchaeota archaeon]